MAALRIKSACWVQGLEAIELESVGKPDRHLVFSLSGPSFHLFVGGPEPKECTLMVKWARGKRLHVESQGRFTRDHLFAAREMLLKMDFSAYTVDNALDPFFAKLKEDEDYQDKPHSCGDCGHAWFAIVRMSNVKKVRPLCPKCGSHRTNIVIQDVEKKTA
jgi:hypothetical protein